MNHLLTRPGVVLLFLVAFLASCAKPPAQPPQDKNIQTFVVHKKHY